MIITLFSTLNSIRDQWQSELLEASWQQAQQPGELIRLVACPASQEPPLHALAQVVKTHTWDPHPYTGDQYPGYNKAASILEWLFHNPLNATLLLVDSNSILLNAITDEIEPGTATGAPWRTPPAAGSGPFALNDAYKKLETFCVNRSLELPRVRFPILIHSQDLRKIAARWLELCGIIRAEITAIHGPPLDADLLAYTIAAAEYRISHQIRELVAGSAEQNADKPMLDYSMPIESDKGEIVWDHETYQAWQVCYPERAKAGAGREFLSYLQEFTTLRESGGYLSLRRPKRCHGVREARVLDRMLLDIPGQKDSLTLNSSAAIIWELCDDKRTLLDIVDEIEKRFEAPRTTLYTDVELTINQLRCDGAVNLEALAP